MTLEGLLHFTALLLAGVLGALIIEPAKLAVRLTTERVLNDRRRR